MSSVIRSYGWLVKGASFDTTRFLAQLPCVPDLDEGAVLPGSEVPCSMRIYRKTRTLASSKMRVLEERFILSKKLSYSLAKEMDASKSRLARWMRRAGHDAVNARLLRSRNCLNKPQHNGGDRSEER